MNTPKTINTVTSTIAGVGLMLSSQVQAGLDLTRNQCIELYPIAVKELKKDIYNQSYESQGGTISSNGQTGGIVSGNYFSTDMVSQDNESKAAAKQIVEECLRKYGR